MIYRLVEAYLQRRGLRPERVNEDYPVLRPLDPNGLEVLRDPGFQASCRAIDGLTLLDTQRLANLWMWARNAPRGGCLIEIGSYRGGSALHLSNACPDRRLYVCDAFSSSFSALDPALDRRFASNQFTDNSRAEVERLFTSRGRDAVIIDGFAPASLQAANIEPGPIAFAHVDVDVYQATREILVYLRDRMLPSAGIALDDVHREASGVDRAIAEFTEANPHWRFVPVFPGQGLLIKPAVSA